MTSKKPKIISKNDPYSLRPRCPHCGRELVQADLEIGAEIVHAWICDCENQPAMLNTDIVRAREWDDMGLVYVFELESGDDTEPA